MTPEGHALSAWITFSAYRDHDETVVQVQALERTSDPFIELSYMFGANRANDRFWEQTLENLARSLGVGLAGRRQPEGVRRPASAVEVRRQRAPQRGRPHGRRDGHRAGSLGPSAAGRGVTAGTRRGPVRARARSQHDRRAEVDARSTRSSSGAVRTGSPRRSSWRGRDGRSGSTRPPTTVGGGTRSAELTLPGFVHDVCSAAHPLGIASPFFRSLDLARHGLEWVHPEAPVAHALTPDAIGRARARPRRSRVRRSRDALGADAAAWASAVRSPRRRVGAPAACRSFGRSSACRVTRS